MKLLKLKVVALRENRAGGWKEGKKYVEINHFHISKVTRIIIFSLNWVAQAIKDALALLFEQHPPVLRALLDTGDAMLVEPTIVNQFFRLS